MKDNFDDLSDDFLNEGDGEKKPKKSKRKGGKKPSKGFGIEHNNTPIDMDNLPDDMPEEIKNIIESLSDCKEQGGNIQDDLNLGEPDDVETTEEDGNTIEKSTWNTEFGSITRISIDGELPEGANMEEMSEIFRKKLGLDKGWKKIKKPKKLTLKEQLKVALKEEDYLEAARLRDEIKVGKKPKSKKKETVAKPKEGQSRLEFLLDILKDFDKNENSENDGNPDTDKDSDDNFWDDIK